MDTHSIKIIYKNENKESKTVNIDLYDSSGQERFVVLLPAVFRDCMVYIFVFSFENIETLKNLQKWRERVIAHHKREEDKFKENEETNQKKLEFVLIGNKKDLKKDFTAEQENDFQTLIDKFRKENHVTIYEETICKIEDEEIDKVKKSL